MSVLIQNERQLLERKASEFPITKTIGLFQEHQTKPLSGSVSFGNGFEFEYKRECGIYETFAVIGQDLTWNLCFLQRNTVYHFIQYRNVEPCEKIRYVQLHQDGDSIDSFL